MDLTPAFFDRWREHRELQYMDKVREVFDGIERDEALLEPVRRRARAVETHATLKHSGFEVGEPEGVQKVLDTGATENVGPIDVLAVTTYAGAHDVALAAAVQQAPVTTALLDDLHRRLCGGGADTVDHGTDEALSDLCGWLAAPPDELHPVVAAALGHLELLQLRRWPDGNGRLARLTLLMLLTRDGYGYDRLLAPSLAWRDPRASLEEPADDLTPEEAETHPAVERMVHDIAASVRDMVAWVRAETSFGSVWVQAFNFPVQP